MNILLCSLLSLIFVGTFVQLAKRINLGKSVRKDGPKDHLAKEGTPTMGGIAFFSAALLSWLLLGEKSADAWTIVALCLSAAAFGAIDDIIALRRKRQEDASTGLFARYRLLGQSLLALGFSIYAVNTGHSLLNIPWLDILGFSFIIVASINAINISDGLDGLAAGMMSIMLLPFLGLAFVPYLLGSLLGFLWYNSKPARIFMGGVGSEGLGAALAGTAILAGWAWYLPLLALIPVLEVLSVIVQVSYFRLTGGKRLLKMSPLHHHFELSGWSEGQVVMRFWLITALATALTWGLRGPQ